MTGNCPLEQLLQGCHSEFFCDYCFEFFNQSGGSRICNGSSVFKCMTIEIWLPTSLLIISAVLDLRFGKFPNWLFVASSCLGVLGLFLRLEMREFMLSLLFSVLFFIALAPLVYFKVFGAGDIKLLASFSLFTSVPIAATVLVYSLFWGLLMGLLKVFLSGQFKNFTYSFILKNPQVKSQKIPYVVAILMGWCSFLVVGDVL